MKTPLLYRIGRASAAHPFRALAGFVAAVAIVMSLNMAFGGDVIERGEAGAQIVDGLLLQWSVVVVHDDAGVGVAGAGDMFAP